MFGIFNGSNQHAPAAAIYTCVSTKKRGERGFGIISQEQTCLDKCKSKQSQSIM
jgi:hypothetical protein